MIEELKTMAKKITMTRTRVEGHGKVTITWMIRGVFLRPASTWWNSAASSVFVQGRPYWEIPVLVQRLCGICPVSHHLAGAKAMDIIAGVPPAKLTPTAEKSGV